MVFVGGVYPYGNGQACVHACIKFIQGQMTLYKIVCEECGKEIMKPKDQRFCSHPCAVKYNRAKGASFAATAPIYRPGGNS